MIKFKMYKYSKVRLQRQLHLIATVSAPHAGVNDPLGRQWTVTRYDGSVLTTGHIAKK